MTTEITSPFTKSSYSDQQGDCVEVACTLADGRAVRDSKRPTGPALTFPAEAWHAFVATL
ncbi:DUF397 domain-containing protein [Streptomyces candidus]|uniref:DUF397 domain-containing protein n=1 Tax=Streptomyces candidus TaxID=67283 RepID=UPI0016168BA3|nr:DUF397 domain-containing protein [Streptomyces candidus]GHH46958.1 DUF397 domain-containing protein [Streptomyces candidus]